MIEAVISYSMTGNNLKLAEKIAERYSVNHIKVSEEKKRNYLSIGVDRLLNRVPKINENIDSIDGVGKIVIVGPVWMGAIASPLREIFKQLKKIKNDLVFVSICGGADGENKNLQLDIEKRAGRKAIAIIEFHTLDLISKKSEDIRKVIDEYKFTEENFEEIFLRFDERIKTLP